MIHFLPLLKHFWNIGTGIWRKSRIWAGNPAKLIRKRFSDDVIELLLKIR
jgi:acetyltransferase-like isoleucine patch superfamily enzyme